MKQPHGAALDAVLVGVAKLAVSGWVLRHGFTQISDDDYARTTIAELFAHAPRLDPSGTSWLPFPFWLTGGAMLVLGRTLVTARAAAIFASSLAAAAAHLALRRAGLTRRAAFAASLVAAWTPWSAWAGAAPVPEGFVGPLVAIGLFACGADAELDVTLGGAAALFAASLSRYEAWPACALFACVLALRVLRDVRRPAEAASADTSQGRGATATRIVAIAIAIAGPLGWMAWNHHAHGSATHFLARVANYRHAIGADGGPLLDGLLAYPRALVVDAPDVALLALAAGVACALVPTARARLRVPLAGAALTLAFLVAGELEGGAPTHHPVRALLAVFLTLTACGADGVRALAERFAWGRAGREAIVAAGVAGATLAWALSLPARLVDAPGRSSAEDRKAQIERGDALRAEGADHVTVTPCAYEHFALIAAFGAPERVVVAKGSSASGEVTPLPNADCPRVDVRR